MAENLNIAVSLRNKCLNEGIRESGLSNKTGIRWYSSTTSDGGLVIDVEFNTANNGRMSLKNPVSLAVPKGHIVDELWLYEAKPTGDRLSIIHLEDDPEHEIEEKGNFTASSGTYLINDLELIFKGD